MISIIIPVYNMADKIGKCLDSIIKQTYSNIEIIIVNDGSTDNIDEVVKKYKNILGNEIEYIKQDNAGAPAARNAGFRKSKCEFIIFCDADSELKPRALKIMLDTLKRHTEASYVYSSFLWGKKLFKVGVFDKDKLRSAPCIHTMALIRRNDFTNQGWDESINKLQDWDLWLTMLDEGKIGYFINDVLFKIYTGGVYSSWLPSFAYKFLPFLSNVKKYKQAVEIVKKKHGII